MTNYKMGTKVYFVTEKDCDAPHPYNDVIYVSGKKAEEVCNDLNKRAGADYKVVDYYFLNEEK